jgi:hypothetical protein
MFGRREGGHRIDEGTSLRRAVVFQDQDGPVDQSVTVPVSLVQGVEEFLDALGQEDLPLHPASHDASTLSIFLT